MATSNGNGACMPSLARSGLISIGKAAKLAGCSVQTLRNYSASGKLPCARVQGGMRRYRVPDIESVFGIEEKNREKNSRGAKLLAYIRISDGKRSKGFNAGNEDSDMARQKNRIVSHCREVYGAEPVIFSDIGSGLTYTRKGFTRVLKEILAGIHNGAVLIVENKDRLARFGVELIEMICEAHSVRIIYTDKCDEVSEAKELADDLLSIIHVFSSRSYAMRSAKRQLKHLAENVRERIYELRNSGVAISRISEIVNTEGMRTLDDCGISVGVIRRILSEPIQWEEKAKERNSVELYLRQHVEYGSDSLRLLKCDLYGAYLEWTKEKKLAPVTRNQFSRQCRSFGLKEIKTTNKKGGGPQISFMGITIRGNEKYTFQVKSRPKNTTPPTPKQNSFTVYYSECLKGKFSGYRKELDRAYVAWCRENGHKKISLRDIPRLLMELDGKFATNKKKGYIYNL